MAPVPGPCADGRFQTVNDVVPGSVVLVHGLWMHGLALMLHRRWLARSGFSASTFSYPSVRRDLDANSRSLSRYISRLPGRYIDIVAHSLGGLIVLNMLSRFSAPRVRRIVLMGSPCGGSHCASVLLGIPFVRRILGHSIRDASARTCWEVPASVEIGVISGTRSFGLGRVIPGLPYPNDGVVAAAETWLDGSRDAIALRVSHSEMLISKACAAQVASFLTNGRFSHVHHV